MSKLLITFLSLSFNSSTFAGSLEPAQFKKIHPKIKLDRPIFLTFLPDNSKTLVVAEQSGRIQLLDKNPEIKAVELVDLSKSVSRSGNEEGLLGLAFDPDYLKNRFIYLYYSSVKPPRHTQLSRFEVSTQTPFKIKIESEKILLQIAQPFSNHNGGMIAFGPDKHLYLGVGDGGSAGDPQNNAQNLNVLLGKILRILPEHDGNYRVPKDNPFANQKNKRGEIWAYGLRNPWRFSFDPEGNIWLGDVGQDALEEIDIIKKGGNYGWSVFEGRNQFKIGTTLKPQVFIPPFYQYSHSDGLSVTGGYVYQGNAVNELINQYIFGDFVSGTVWALPSKTKVKDNNAKKIGKIPALASFGQGEDGQLYALSLNGSIYELGR